MSMYLERNKVMNDFEDREFKSEGRNVIVRRCPKTFHAFLEINATEEQVVDLAIKQIVYHSLMSKVRKQKLTEIIFEVPKNGKSNVTKLMNALNKLSPEERAQILQSFTE